MHHAALSHKWFPQPLDRVVISLILGLGLLIGLLLWSGDRTAPRVRDFSWQNQQIGAEDRAFTLTFSRLMDQASVAANLRISPPLPGKIGWAGRRMAYTLTEPAPYETAFQISLEGARDRFSSKSNQALMQPFLGQFATRDRAFIYLGVTDPEIGRLMLYNLTRQQKIPLTPPNLIVDEYEPYPDGDRILFSATSQIANTQGLFKLFDPQLYTVSIDVEPRFPNQQKITQAPAGKIRRVLDNTNYKIHKFDLSADGKTIVVERIDKRQSGLPSLSILKLDSAPKRLDIEPGADFTITPDSTALIVDLGRGLAIFPLESGKTSRPVFLPRFSRVLSFAQDGSVAAMLKVNHDDSLSLVQVLTQGAQKELLRSVGSIYSAQFNPRNQVLYCLLSQTHPGEDYQDQHPYLVAINLQTGKLTSLVTLPKLAAINLQTGKLDNSVSVSSRQDWKISLAPDGRALLYAQTNSMSQSAGNLKHKPTGNLRLFPVLPLHDQPVGTSSRVQPQSEALPLAGFHPIWLP